MPARGAARIDGLEAVDQHQQQAPPSCRFCYDSQAPLIEPCGCSGSQAFVHPACLSKWQIRCIEQLEYKRAEGCDICGHQYPEKHQEKVPNDVFSNAMALITWLRKNPALVFLTYVIVLVFYLDRYEGMKLPFTSTTCVCFVVAIMIIGVYIRPDR